MDLAAEGIVVVTIQSRTNIFGWLTLHSQDAPGNLGLLDQGLAFQWIEENIHKFGGDKQQMTLLGHGSSGATNAMLHLTNPKTAALFARMILMSGTIYSTYSYQNTVETMNATADTDLSLAIVKKLACGSVHVKYTLDCLRQKSVNDILKAFEHVYEVHLIDTIPFRFECLKLFQFSTKFNGFGFFYSLNILIIPAWKLYKIIGSTN